LISHVVQTEELHFFFGFGVYKQKQKELKTHKKEGCQAEGFGISTTNKIIESKC
jgi:hypothetical protein